MEVPGADDGSSEKCDSCSRVSSHTTHYRERGTDCRQDGNDELDDVFDRFLFHRDLVLG